MVSIDEMTENQLKAYIKVLEFWIANKPKDGKLDISDLLTVALSNSATVKEASNVIVLFTLFLNSFED